MYFDNGATTWPKPEAVLRAVNRASRQGANPGRSGHRLSVQASEMIYRCREEAAQLFGEEKTENVIFMPNCTQALNTVIHGVLQPGDHAVISSLEHNAVVRPLTELQKIGVSYSVAEVAEGDDEQTLQHFREQIRENTKLVVCTHASNVFGIRLPVERLAAMCKIYGIRICVDAAQTAGAVPINMADSDIDYLCAAGHKGLYGPMGTGLLVIHSDLVPKCLVQGGTGSMSASTEQPEIMPDYFESGTPNLAGIAGLREGIRFVRNRTEARIYAHEMRLAQQLWRGLEKMPRVRLYTAFPEKERYLPVISFNIGDTDSEQTAALLGERYGIAVRAGLHCAPLAHAHKGTQEQGTVRAVMSVFNTEQQVAYFLQSVNKITRR